MNVIVAAGPRDRLRFERHHLEIIRKTPPGRDRVQTRHQLGVLRGDTGWIPAFMPVVVGSGSRPELLVLGLPLRIIVADRNERGGSDRHRISAKRQGLGDVRARTHAAGDD